MRFYYILKRKVRGTLEKKFNIHFPYSSETAKVRHLVLQYCNGKGCDIGFGGDKIKKENCDGIDYPQPYTKVGQDPVDIGCDVINEEIPVDDSTYDYVYSSHLIEDFKDIKKGLEKFIRILKSEGHLILAFPDQQVYEKICYQKAIPLNPYHVHKEMSLAFMLDKLNSISNISYKVLFSSNCKIDYNVVLVLQIHKK